MCSDCCIAGYTVIAVCFTATASTKCGWRHGASGNGICDLMTNQLRHHNQLSGDWAGCISCDQYLIQIAQYTNQAEVHQDALLFAGDLPH